MNKIIITIVSIGFFIAFALPAHAQYFVSAEYAPFSNHLSDTDAPAGGYNETNHVTTLKIGKSYHADKTWAYNISAGITGFKNSYDKSSFGAGIGLETLYNIDQNWGIYAGGDIGLISGYEDNVDEDYQILGDLIPFLVLNGGGQYQLDNSPIALRAGLKYVPASIVDSDDVVLGSVGLNYKF